MGVTLATADPRATPAAEVTAAARVLLQATVDRAVVRTARPATEAAATVEAVTVEATAVAAVVVHRVVAGGGEATQVAAAPGAITKRLRSRRSRHGRIVRKTEKKE